ncbi:Transcriptional regulator, AraC family [Chitinispirillum alkaliphilum]|nr:Transcriptional regulator, AraC family [Chitinispirillum alkaliphilum]
MIFLFHRVTITPGEENLRFITYSDSEDYGIECSEVLSLNVDRGLAAFSYTIGTKRDYPYIGMAVERTDSTYWNLARFNKITLRVDKNMTTPYTLLLGTMEEGFSSEDKPVTWRLFQDDINEISGERISLPMKHMQTPTWWFGTNSLSKNNNRKSLSRVRMIRLQNHPLAPRNTPQRIHLQRITFSHSAGRIMLFLVPSLGLMLFPLIKREKRLPGYRPLAIENRQSEELSILEEFIGKEYNRLDLSLQTVIRDTGLSEKSIRHTLKSKYGKGFIEYLTHIRMNEAARLLCQSDRQIAEIALFVGYRHPTTFTKIFNRTFGVSPRKYREHHRNNDT